MKRTASTKILALCGAVGMASAAILIKADGLNQDVALVNTPIDGNTNAIVLKQAADAVPDTAFLEGSELHFSTFSAAAMSRASSLSCPAYLRSWGGAKTPDLGPVC